MPNGTDERAGVPLRAMPTSNRHRTSAPTDEALRAAIAHELLARPDRKKPSADMVIFAALRLAAAAKGALTAEIERIEAERFTAPPPAAGG